MATTYTRYLKLKLADNMTADAISNLQKIDQLGSSFSVSTTETLTFNSVKDIYFRPNSADVDGTGIGGNLYISTNDQLLDSVQINSLYTSIAGSLRFRNGNYHIELVAPTLSGNLTFTLPPQDGTNGQVLATDGHGNLQFVDMLGGGGKQSGFFMWLPADGTTKIIPHNYNSSDVIITIYDTVGTNLVYVDNISINDVNTITLTAVVVPGVTGYKVFIQEV